MIAILVVMACTGEMTGTDPTDAAGRDAGRDERDGGIGRADAGSAMRDAGATSDAGIEPTDCVERDCHYVRAGATGDGSDWANALPSLPDTLVRGDIYFVGAGSYDAYTFDDDPAGEETIVVRRATAVDHGTDVGWSDAYDGAAAFGSPLRFTQGFYVVDGRVRNEADWFDGASYGFRVEHRGEDQNIVIQSYGVSIRRIEIRYVFVDAIVGDLPDRTIRRYAIDTDGFDGGSTATELVFSRMFVRGSNNVWFLRTTDGAIVEYSASDAVAGNSANHGEIVNLYYSGDNAIVRYNHFRNAYLEGGGTALVAITYAHGLEFYGNVAEDFAVGDGAVGFLGGDASRCRIYNNTIVRARAAAGFASDGSDNEVFNNVFIDYGRVGIDGTHDFNTFSGESALGEANGETGARADLFADYAGGDYRLARDTTAGRALHAPYDVDPSGAMRGGDGTWDRGAFER
jgi:hypothetical protein